PTTGLDVTTQKTVMDLLAEITARRDMAMILITHDLGLAAQYCQRVAVMEQGLVVEEAPPATLFGNPRHPYTKRLVAASPTRNSTVESLVVDAGEPVTPAVRITPRRESEPLLKVSNLVKTFDNGFRGVDDVSFALAPGESLGLVGESGSGKSTISRLVCRLLDHSAGTIAFDGEDIGKIASSEFYRSRFRKDIQIVFQDHGDSLNPRFSAFDCIADPLRLLAGVQDSRELRTQVTECALRVGLPVEFLDRFPHQLSGGQKARVGIARAIAARPRLLVLDEPTAALDVSVQAVILHLLDRLRRETGLAYLFVSHDLNVVRMMCERTIVLQTGQIVEQGPSGALFSDPASDYARQLIAAIPHFDPEAAMTRARELVPAG
ncbi:MAG: ATP-binding cassette domain-containing protein, partial [Phreatobacter sp.]|nr:ATP-binding cassette domain-containing protein [Phreatobacter sp.]